MLSKLFTSIQSFRGFKVAECSDGKLSDLDPTLPDDPDFPQPHDSQPHLDGTHDMMFSGPGRNPGSFERLQEDQEFLQFEIYEGFRLDYSRQLLETFAVQHNISLSANNEEPSTYSFSTQLTGTNRDRPEFLVGKMDSQFDFFARTRFHLSDNVAVGAQIRSAANNEEVDGHVDIEVAGDTSTSVARFNPNGLYTLSYNQAITSAWIAGVEMLHSEQGGGSLMRMGTKFTSAFATYLITGATNGIMSVAFVRPLTERIKLGTDLTFYPTQTGTLESTMTAGWEYRLGPANQPLTVIKGRVTSDGRVGFCFEDILQPNLKATIAGELDHSLASYKLGLGFELYT